MSSAGTIYRELVYQVEDTSSGTKTIDFILENDGCIITFERLSGTAFINGTIKSNLPDLMTSLEHEDFNINDNYSHSYAYIMHQQGRLVINWNAATNFKVAIKMASGHGVAMWRSQQGSAPQEVSISAASPDTVLRDTKLISLTKENNELLRIMVNHLRHMTNINADQGDIY